MTASSLGLQTQIVCPHCWHGFGPEQLLWIAEHHELLGDSVLGPEEPVRFRPSRFSVDCKAVDARGMTASRLACPRCHLLIPRQLVDCPPVFTSIIGVPASGKSYFLTSMVWELRHRLPGRFDVLFTDADPAANQSLIDNEQTLFLQPDATRFVELEKTDLQGALYSKVALGEHAMLLPRPFMFFVRPNEHHPNGRQSEIAKQLHRVLCLYDNAGESFQPGRDTSASPVTQHLGKAHFLMFLFDPTQDPRIRARIGEVLTDETRAPSVQRQETVLIEAAVRVRRQVGLIDGTRHKRPLIVVVPKMDVWEHLLDAPVGNEPFITGAVNAKLDAVDHAHVERVSASVRRLLLASCPELVAAAESFCEHVVYIPVTAMGTSPQKDSASTRMVFRAQDIRPRWVTVPMAYGLSKYLRGLIAGRMAAAKPAVPSA